jgi:hypothetical protein
MVVGAARYMLKAKSLPGWFWGEAVIAVVYILNRVLCKDVEGGKMPFEVWYGRKPAIHHLKVFGCIVYVRNTLPSLKKLEDRGRKMIFVGYERCSKAYRAYDPLTGRVTISHDVVFDESAQWSWSEGDHGSGDGFINLDDTFTVQYRVLHGGEGVDAQELEPRTPQAASTHPGAGLITPAYRPPVVVSEGSSEDDLDADHNNALLRLRSINEVVGASTPPEYVMHVLSDIDEQLHVASVEEPTMVAQATREVVWRKAMEEELCAIKDDQTWTVTDLPTGWCAIGLKWVLKVKRDKHGVVVHHKARLIVKGYAQRQGIGYEEVFAPVARMEVVQLLLAMAAREGVASPPHGR